MLHQNQDSQHNSERKYIKYTKYDFDYTRVHNHDTETRWGEKNFKLLAFFVKNGHFAMPTDQKPTF